MKNTPSINQQSPKSWQMPRPGAIVVWRNALAADSCFAIVTKVGRNAVNMMLIPPDSKLGIPKDSVRHVDDPWNEIHGVNADAGVWDFTDEHRLMYDILRRLERLEARPTK